MIRLVLLVVLTIISSSQIIPTPSNIIKYLESHNLTESILYPAKDLNDYRNMKTCIKADHKYYTLNAFVGFTFRTICICVLNNYILDYLDQPHSIITIMKCSKDHQ